MQHQTQTQDCAQQRRLPLSALLPIGALLAIVGWEPHERHKPAPAGSAISAPAQQAPTITVPKP